MILRGGMAFDRASVRSFDNVGRLHISVTNISKAAVNDYYGHEIPGCDELGLDPNKLYSLLRDPQELAKAAPTFNNLPVLSKHVPVTAEEPEKEFVIGSTGTDAQFVAPYLRNSAVIWDQDAIDLIEGEKAKEWSCGYNYRPDMTPGNFNGLRYDGVMRDIIGNHVALVKEGRAGSDVVVGDEKPMIKSRRALMLNGALAAFVAPKLAMDAKVDLAPALKGVTAKSLSKSREAIAGKVVAALKGKLAQDEAVDVDDVVTIIKAVEGAEMSEPDDIAKDDDDMMDTPPAVDADGDVMAKLMAFLKGKLSEEDMQTVASMCGGPAMDEDDDTSPAAPPGGKKPDDDKPAMDARTVHKLVAEMREAERAVEPHIGRITTAQDSPEAVYKMALDAKGVDTEGVPPKAYKAMVKMLPTDKGAKTGSLAMDAKAGQSDFEKRFPNAPAILHV